MSGLSRPGLNAIDLQLEAGEIVSVMGRSGAGKSLLLRALADLDESEGAVSLEGRDRSSFSGPEWRRHVSYVPAESGWWETHVDQHFPAVDIAAGYLVRLGFPTDALSWEVDRLSTGERQRLALLRVMVLQPKIMLLDEPTSALDPEAMSKVESVLHEKRDAGMAIIFVTHDKAQAARLATRHYVMDAGTIQPGSS